MRKKAFYITGFLTIIIFFAFKFVTGCRIVNNPAPDAYPKIQIQKPMLLNESALGDAWKLVDEQQLIGDPAKGTGKKPVTSWVIDWNKKDYYPISAVIDLGGFYELSHIYLYDGSGVGSLVISGGEPFRWQSFVTDN